MTLTINKFDEIHFIGIGGSGMAPIAGILLKMGYNITGSDLNDNTYTQKLKLLGARIYFEHNPSNIRTSKLIVVSSAIKESNPEYSAAKKAKIPVVRRAEMLSWIMDQHANKIAVAGTHGKTTTSAMLATAIEEIGLKPTYVIGGTISNYNKNSELGERNFAIAEADESDKSFLFLNPSSIIITNIEEDHMDNFKDIDEIKDIFSQFFKKMTPGGTLIINGDDKNSNLIKPKSNYLTYGLSDKNDVSAKNINLNFYSCQYDLYIDHKLIQKVNINVPGTHNVYNSLSIFALCHFYKLDLSKVAKGLEKFSGTSRRLQKVGEHEDILIYDDYAHHPTEVQATLEAVKSSWPKKNVVVIFQPHRFSRLQFMMPKFPSSFQKADQVILTDVFSAGEEEIEGINSKELSNKINKLYPNKSTYIAKLTDISKFVKKHKQKDTIYLTMGAGSITTLGKEILFQFKLTN